MKTLALGAIAAILSTSVWAQTWQHSGQPAQLIELFTSEGCSSCPPADKYLSQFASTKHLWQSVIPVAYHVDYWDYIGWKDKFAQPKFSQQQRLYRAYGVTSGVYTPGFVVNGKEWRGFFNRTNRTLPENAVQAAGPLRLTKQKNVFHLSFDSQEKLTAHIVLLAMDEVTQVARGENKGRQLHHDFVALTKEQAIGKGDWTFEFSTLPNNADAVAVWLTREGEYHPVQTVAGPLE
ncbi:DUF1223 domain-containing protein [Vibrio rumoiensis]|uniref:DUF1223 domain-containing protein n=1 Tax=Vibrio rumoiensis TaxID=76258 RepID=UPI003AA9DFC9